MKKLLSVKEVCDSLGICKSMFYKLQKTENKISIIKLGKRTFVYDETLIQWIKKWNLILLPNHFNINFH